MGRPADGRLAAAQAVAVVVAEEEEEEEEEEAAIFPRFRGLPDTGG